ncbi:Pyrophosphate--fructose 6-phosphate 1-phosphotransferase [Balamuthia mandrillaris]
MKGDFMQITAELLSRYRNQGGFDIIGTGRDKIETEEQFLSSRLVCEKLGLDGLVVIGGDDSNTNAAVLAEYFKSHHLPTRVIGVPKTIDGDLKTDLGVEVSFGFDSACKVFSSLIGNIEADANSSQKYYHFIRLMGRSASHITLECALQTHPNITLIGEEVAAKRQTLEQITNSICQVISARADKGKNFGVVLLPEGLIEFVPEVHALISELNELLADGVSPDHVRGKLSEASRSVFDFLPSSIRNELLLERDPHGNVQVSLIETEKLLIHLVKAELKKRKASGSFKGKFAAMGHFFGYEGRCVMPSNFDAHYCYTLGRTAAALLTDAHVHHRHGNHHVTGYIATVRNLTAPVAEWKVGGIPLTSLMNIERRKGKDKPVIRKALVKLEGAPFKELCRNRERWALHECYRNPGPIQYEGIAADQPNITLLLEYGQQRCNSQRSAL